MKYMLLIYVDEASFQKASKAQVDETMAGYRAWSDAMKKAGVLAGADRLHPSPTAVTVKNAGGSSTKVLNGPYAESKEQLGGFFVVDVKDRDAACAWAAQCPSVIAGHGSVEVREVWAM